MTVCHREYVSDVIPSTESSSGTFQLLLAHKINPGNSLLFPWLSQIATRFESYNFKALKFVYEPQCPTTSAGTVMQVVDYDASDDPPINKTQMMAYKGAVRSPPWFCSSNQSDPSDLHKQKSYFVRNTAQSGTQDPRLYDVGIFFLAFEGAAASSFYAGELYVEYCVEFMTPNLEPTVNSGMAAVGPGASDTWAQFAAGATQFGPQSPNLIYSASYPSGVLISPQVPGLYSITVYVASASTTTAALNLTAAAPTGSNVNIDSANSWENLVPTGKVGWTAQITVTVEFPNDTDYVVIETAGQDTSATIFTQMNALITPISQATQNFPPPSNNTFLLKRARDLARIEGDRRNFLCDKSESSSSTDTDWRRAVRTLATASLSKSNLEIRPKKI